MPPTTVKNTPSALKWLAEKRARIANDLLYVEKLCADLDRRRASLRDDIAALDRTLCLYDSRIDPSKIQPIRAFKGRYGARGGMTAAILQVLKAHDGEWVSTTTMAIMVCGDLQLAFDTQQAYSKWYLDSFRSALKRLVKTGQIERETEPGAVTHEETRWRLPNARAHSTLAALEQSVTEAAAAMARAPN